MLSLKLFRDQARGVADLLNWAALVDDGIVLGKDGSLLAGFAFRGPDLASSTAAELNACTARLASALARISGDGWATWHDAVRMPAADYPPPRASHFPDPVTRLIDEERRGQFLAEGTHFECEYAWLVQYLPPLRRSTRLAEYVFSDDHGEPRTQADRVLETFKQKLAQLEDALSGVLHFRRLAGYEHVDERGRRQQRDELVNYLQCTLTGVPSAVNLPPGGCYLDAVLGGRELWAGETPRYGEDYLACVAIDGFPAYSYPGILASLDVLAIPFRWSSRFLFLDARTADRELRKYRRKWSQMKRGFWSQVFRTQGGVVNQDALLMEGETEAAMADASSGLVRFGFYTPVITLRSRSKDEVLEQAHLVVREVEATGFACRIETVNALEAWLGSLPGHAVPNVRRPLFHTLNLAEMVPISSVWVGHDAAPCPYYPPGSPPLLHAATYGATPFRLNLHVGDLGHTLVAGPTGAGKSTLLAFIAAQFRRYPSATVWAFDKGRSLLALALSAGGSHHEIGTEGSELAFCPLSRLERAADVAWAEEWLAGCFELQAGRRPTPQQVQEIHRAVALLASGPHRSLTDFASTVQDQEIRAALAHYTMEGSLGGLLDSRADGLVASAFQVFEMEDLMAMGEPNVLPVLTYLFRRFAEALRGQPALLILDEAWVFLRHPVFRAKIVEWLKVLRKANCAVVLATQSLSDAAHSGILDILQESCPTKIFLPNEEADQDGVEGHPGPAEFYRAFGLNEQELAIIKNARKKRDYYYRSPEGRRLFDLGLGPVALAFTGVSDKAQVARVKELAEAFGESWPFEWLRERGAALPPLTLDAIGESRPDHHHTAEAQAFALTMERVA